MHFFAKALFLFSIFLRYLAFGNNVLIFRNIVLSSEFSYSTKSEFGRSVKVEIRNFLVLGSQNIHEVTIIDQKPDMLHSDVKCAVSVRDCAGDSQLAPPRLHDASSQQPLHCLLYDQQNACQHG